MNVRGRGGGGRSLGRDCQSSTDRTASSDGVDECVLLTVDLRSPLSPSAPLKMSESRFEGIEKMTKKQNKEQVPPPAETESKKPSSSKPAKKAANSNTVSQPAHKNLEEAFKAVSEAAAAAAVKTLIFRKKCHLLQSFCSFEY